MRLLEGREKALGDPARGALALLNKMGCADASKCCYAQAK
jgi:hypothetical protein